MEKHQDGIWIIDANGNTLYANQRMAEILGTSEEEMVGQSSFAYVFPEDASAAQGWFKAKQRGDPSPFHFKLRRKDRAPVRGAQREYDSASRQEKTLFLGIALVLGGSSQAYNRNRQANVFLEYACGF